MSSVIYTSTVCWWKQKLKISSSNCGTLYKYKIYIQIYIHIYIYIYIYTSYLVWHNPINNRKSLHILHLLQNCFKIWYKGHILNQEIDQYPSTRYNEKWWPWRDERWEKQNHTKFEKNSAKIGLVINCNNLFDAKQVLYLKVKLSTNWSLYTMACFL